MAEAGERWIRFIRQYGPMPRNENVFDEHIRTSAHRLQVRALSFLHPLQDSILALFSDVRRTPRVIVLTGTAGDGKSNLCGRVWNAVGGDAATWTSDDVYFQTPLAAEGRTGTLHVIRDLTALPENDRKGRYASKADLLEGLSVALSEPGADTYLLAANDGQLIEAWRRLGNFEHVVRARALFEARLMGDEDPEPSPNLAFFNLSTVSSATVLALSLDAFLEHEGWQHCYQEAEEDGFFGPKCPIRRNYELLRDALVRSRLEALFRLCDYNELHTPIRRVLMLLANAVLGHPAAKDRLMLPANVRGFIASRDTGRASLYANLFGANLGGTKRESLEIFDYLSRFGIGDETTNRIDNILIFGNEDDNLRPYYETLMTGDLFYGATDRYLAAQHAYIERPEATSGERHVFLDMLAERRRGLFFKIPEAWADELKLWRLTVFSGAGDYLDGIAAPLEAGGRVSRHILTGLVRGLNRIFTGMLVSSDRELLLATSLSFSGARVSQLLEDRIAVSARGRREKVDISMRRGFPCLDVHLPNGSVRWLRLNLTRYEFLMRVSGGALPGNFSRECYEDILAFKSSLLAAAQSIGPRDSEDDPQDFSFRLLSLDASGNPVDDVVEVARG